MGRPRTPIGAFGDISYVKISGQRVRARTRYRDDDGKIRRVSATGATTKQAERNLKTALARRPRQVASGEITADSSFARLVQVWLEDLDLENKVAPSTRALYERNMRQLVMPAFEHYSLREITLRKVDHFIKTLAATKSYSMAKQARTVLGLAFGLAVRYDALAKNPVRDTTRLRKPRSHATALQPHRWRRFGPPSVAGGVAPACPGRPRTASWSRSSRPCSGHRPASARCSRSASPTSTSRSRRRQSGSAGRSSRQPGNRLTASPIPRPRSRRAQCRPD